jgi:transcriptional regulator with XRE-family HTH domain
MEYFPYNARHDALEELIVPKSKLPKGEVETFGERLARLRKAAGFSLRALGEETGISHRMIYHYEKHAESPPAHLVPGLARALGVSVEELLGLEKPKRNGRSRDTKLWRRFQKLEKLPLAERKPIIQLLDTFLARARTE